jgi:hypothetical protein
MAMAGLLLSCGGAAALAAAYLAPGTWSDGPQNSHLEVVVAASAECGATSGSMNLTLTSAKPLSKLLLLSGDSTMCDFTHCDCAAGSPWMAAASASGQSSWRATLPYWNSPRRHYTQLAYCANYPDPASVPEGRCHVDAATCSTPGFNVYCQYPKDSSPRSWVPTEFGCHTPDAGCVYPPVCDTKPAFAPNQTNMECWTGYLLDHRARQYGCGPVCNMSCAKPARAGLVCSKQSTTPPFPPPTCSENCPPPPPTAAAVTAAAEPPAAATAAAAPPPLFEAHPGVDDASVSARLAANDTEFVKALGPTVDPVACAAACVDWKNASDPAARCESFTWYNSSTAAEALRGRCYAHVTTMWVPHVSAVAFSGRIKYPCTSELDCSLNGQCTASPQQQQQQQRGDGNTAAGGGATAAACACHAGWRGLRCGELDLLPVARGSGFNSSQTSSWGAAIIGTTTITGAGTTERAAAARGQQVPSAAAAAQQYYSFTCEWSHRCGVNAWFTNSQVSLAVSSTPTGPFTRSKLLWPAFATNPTIVRAPQTGEYVLMMGMATANGSARVPDYQCTNCTDLSTPRGGCTSHRPPFYTNIATSMSLDGPWVVKNLLGHRGWGYNFAMVINDDGSAVGVTRLGFVNSSQWDDPTAWRQPIGGSIPFSSERLAAGEGGEIALSHLARSSPSLSLTSPPL